MIINLCLNSFRCIATFFVDHPDNSIATKSRLYFFICATSVDHNASTESFICMWKTDKFLLMIMLYFSNGYSDLNDLRFIQHRIPSALYNITLLNTVITQILISKPTNTLLNSFCCIATFCRYSQ